jgi:hypothetical protein
VRSKTLQVVAGVLLLIIRGVLLWLVIPVGTLIWIVSLQGFGPNKLGLGAFLGWIDNNLVFALERGPLRPLFPEPTVLWIPASERSRVTHRVRGMDLF